MQLQLNQEKLDPSQQLDEQTIDEVLGAIKSELDIGDVSISAAFVDEEQIRALNKEYRGKNKVTDVLSFPYAGNGEAEDDGVIGEVLICYAQANRQAQEVNHSVRDEVIFLLVHGILHVFGYDHIEEADRDVMFPLQEKILKRLEIESKL